MVLTSVQCHHPSFRVVQYGHCVVEGSFRPDSTCDYDARNSTQYDGTLVAFYETPDAAQPHYERTEGAYTSEARLKE